MASRREGRRREDLSAIFMALRGARAYTEVMKISRFMAAALVSSLLTACTGPDTRIKTHQAAFDSYPPPVQQKIRRGQADVGFTKEQVTMAMGRPDRVYSRKTAASDQEVWAYGMGSGGPRAGFGFGVGAGGPGPAFSGAGAGIAVDPEDQGELIRVVFQGGKVVGVENRSI
jgi:hypothetical protein